MAYNVEGEKLLPDKITALKNLAKSYEMKLRGFRLDTSNDKWVIAGEALTTSNLITQATGILSSFAENANLITIKTMEKFVMEFADAFFKINVAILNDAGTPQEYYRVVLKMFKDTMSNLGDIITGSRALLDKVFQNDQYMQPREDTY